MYFLCLSFLMCKQELVPLTAENQRLAYTQLQRTALRTTDPGNTVCYYVTGTLHTTECKYWSSVLNFKKKIHQSLHKLFEMGSVNWMQTCMRQCRSKDQLTPAPVLKKPHTQ